MRLVVDTSVLVGELLRAAGREGLGDDRLELFLPEAVRDEFEVELPRRVTAFARRHRLDDGLVADLVAACFGAVDANATVVDAAIYAAAEREARGRSLRDPNDWPIVAVALVVAADIWTNDNDFLGTGIATWTTDSLQAWLDRQPSSGA
jgi:predicted nucleic acid-binding protein